MLFILALSVHIKKTLLTSVLMLQNHPMCLNSMLNRKKIHFMAITACGGS